MLRIWLSPDKLSIDYKLLVFMYWVASQIAFYNGQLGY